MKKVLIAMAALAMVSAFASCSKTCTCSTYVNGDIVENLTVENIDISDSDKYKKCSDMNSSVTLLGQTTEVKCKMQL